jgi:hypothetical protein
VFAVEADTTHTHEELLERGAPLVQAVHLRVETFLALARMLCERRGLDPLPELALERDFHVHLADDRRAMTATVWADSGDAECGPVGRPGTLSLHELLSRLEVYSRGYVQTTSTGAS